MQSNRFLARKAAELCREHFSNQKITNLLVVQWGKPWKSKLGHIKPLKNEQFGSLIEINSILADSRVPDFVLELTLLHELIHYFQGFGSNHVRKHSHPHWGGAVEKELARFGWQELCKKQGKWIKKNFSPLFLEQQNKKK